MVVKNIFVAIVVMKQETQCMLRIIYIQLMSEKIKDVTNVVIEQYKIINLRKRDTQYMTEIILGLMWICNNMKKFTDDS